MDDKNKILVHGESVSNERKHLEINFYGRLKGLAIMRFAEDNARRLRIAGYIKRLPTGTLYVEVEGEESALKNFLKACESREEWTVENSAGFSDRLIGHSGFYIRKFG